MLVKLIFLQVKLILGLISTLGLVDQLGKEASCTESISQVGRGAVLRKKSGSGQGKNRDPLWKGNRGDISY